MARSTTLKTHQNSDYLLTPYALKPLRPYSLDRCQRPVRVVRRGTAAAIRTLTDGPPPRLVIAPHLLFPLVDLALRSARRPLSNHPDEPLSPP